MKKSTSLSLLILFGLIIGVSLPEMSPAAPVQSVLDFGAKGDGTADDTRAIQRAVDSGSGEVIFPSGRYRITETVVIDLDAVGPVALAGNGTARILMEGSGPAFRFVGTHEGTANPSTVQDNVWQSQRMPVVDGLEIIGRHPEAVGIEATGTIQLTITRVLIREVLHGIHLTVRNRNVLITDCHIYENRGIGVYLDDVNLHQINITGSHISYNEGGGIVVRNGQVRNLQIGSCDIEGNMSPEQPATANVFIDMPEGSMREGAIVGCTIQHDHNAPGSANIRFVGHSTEDRRKAGNFTIADNVLSDVQDNIHIRCGRGIIITGNTLWKGYAHNLFIEESSDIVLGPNVLDRNPDYSYGDGGDSKNAVVVRNSYNLTMTGLHISRVIGMPAGLVLDGCRNYNLTNSTLLNCEGGGILLLDSEHGRISDNLISDDRARPELPPAIRVQGGQHNHVSSNFVDGDIEVDPNSAELSDNYTP